MTQSELAGELIHRLRRCFHFVHRMADGGRVSQARVLRLVGFHKEITQRHLQEHLEIGQSSLSELVKKMEDQGLLERSTCENDRRQIMIRLTDTGSSLLEENRQADLVRNTEYLQVLTAEEQTALLNLLTTLDKRWSERYPRPHCGKQEEQK